MIRVLLRRYLGIDIIFDTLKVTIERVNGVVKDMDDLKQRYVEQVELLLQISDYMKRDSEMTGQMMKAKDEGN